MVDAAYPSTLMHALAWLWSTVGGVVHSEAFEWWRVLVSTSVPAWHVFKSLTFAWVFYVFNVCVARTQLYEVIRLKVLVVPLLVLAGTLSLVPDWVWTATALVGLWTTIAITLDVLERRARMQAAHSLHSFRQTRTPPPTLSPSTPWMPPEAHPVVVYASTECVICSEAHTPAAPPFVLLCGHQMHAFCLQKWFHVSRRCPLCRHPCDPEASSALRAIF